jgi:hypothetical protein
MMRVLLGILVAGVLAPYVVLAAGGTVFFDDTFTAGADQNLDAHTPDTGTSWTKVRNNEGDDDIIVSGANDRIQPEGLDGDGGAAYSADVTYPATDYQAQVVCGSTTCQDDTNNYGGVYVKGNATLGTGYIFYEYGLSGDDPVLARITSTTGCTAVDTWDMSEAFFPTSAVVAGSVIRIQTQNDEQIGYVDNVGYMYATDANIRAGGKGGVFMGSIPCDTGGDFGAQSMDNFQILELGVASTTWLAPTTNGEITNQFTNPANAYSSNGSYATENATEGQDYGDFGVVPSANATVRGLQVRVEGNNSSGTRWIEASVEVSIDNGSTWSTPVAGRFNGNGDDNIVFGHANYLWGLTWTDTDLTDSDLRVRITTSNRESAGDVFSLDMIAVKAFWDAGVAPSTAKASIHSWLSGILNISGLMNIGS